MCENVPNSEFDFSTFGQLFGVIFHCATVEKTIIVNTRLNPSVLRD
jgi:hypothetical protein